MNRVDPLGLAQDDVWLGNVPNTNPNIVPYVPQPTIPQTQDTNRFHKSTANMPDGAAEIQEEYKEEQLATVVGFVVIGGVVYVAAIVPVAAGTGTVVSTGGTQIAAASGGTVILTADGAVLADQAMSANYFVRLICKRAAPYAMDQFIGISNNKTDSTPKETLRFPSGVTKEQLIKVASIQGKGGATPIGKAFQKHNSGNRAGTFAGETTGNPSKNTQQGLAYLNRILDNPNSTIVVREHPQFGEIMDIRTPDGTGVRFTSDCKTFIGLLEKYTPRI